MPPLRAALIAIVLLVVACWFGFTKHVPFTHGFRVNAVFSSANQLKKGAPVRIAGVNVGKVTKVERFRGTNQALVTMELGDNGLPLHKDATMKIRPRIFLEGNFFVDLQPGSPNSGNLHDGDTIPVSHTSTPVQFDQVLSALDANTRVDLQRFLQQYGRALNQPPGPGQDADQDPEVRRLTGAQAVRRSLRYTPEALRYSSVVNQAFLGRSPHDLSALVRNLSRVSRALDSREVQLKDLVTNFNRTVEATAAESSNLRQAIALLPPTLRHGYQAFGSLDAALPPARGFARDILPGVRETPATIDLSYPWLRQSYALLGPDELGGVARELRRSSPALGGLIDGSVRWLPQLDLFNRCQKDVILPTGDVKLQDGNQTTGVENYKEFWYAMVGLAGESQNFDGNGPFIRVQPSGGTYLVQMGQTYVGGKAMARTSLDTKSTYPGASQAIGELGNAAAPPLGTRPAWPANGTPPPHVSSVPCYRSGPMSSARLNGPTANGPADPPAPESLKYQNPDQLALVSLLNSSPSSSTPGATARAGRPAKTPGVKADSIGAARRLLP